MISPLARLIGFPQFLLSVSGWLIGLEFNSVPFRLPMSTNSHFILSKFHFIIACFPDTSESFINKSLGDTLPKVSGRREELVDCTEQRSPREGPLITSRVRQLL
ncbi:hypothetical protein V8G54_016016 [Vigna mungo]|uniref:Uncharacterized protein n=1 Tax=Vigna mungo TaxID=3915 RepID=A0AAQ3NKE3_VIGMU